MNIYEYHICISNASLSLSLYISVEACKFAEGDSRILMSLGLRFHAAQLRRLGEINEIEVLAHKMPMAHGISFSVLYR